MLRYALVATMLVAGCSDSPMPLEDAGLDANVIEDAAPRPDAWVWDPDAGCLDNTQTLACPLEASTEVPSDTSDGPAILRTVTTSARVFLCPAPWRVVRCSPTTISTYADGGSATRTTDDCEDRTSPGGDTLVQCSETRTYEVNGELRWEHAKRWESVRVER